MSELSFRQGTVYGHIKSGERRLIINHNPMQLQALRLVSPAPDQAFDLGSLEVITIDELIELRQNEDWQDLGDLPAEMTENLISALLQIPNLPEAIATPLKALQKQQ